ncbi:MAG: hypothetical protein FWH10_04085 [Oscillospiraceae bacterium]|nr:hypothetical protein [Oscillospiraceae bacterium]
MSIENMENTGQKAEQGKIILPKDVQIRMMKFFLRTSIPQKKREEQEKMRLSNTNDGSEK